MYFSTEAYLELIQIPKMELYEKIAIAKSC